MPPSTEKFRQAQERLQHSLHFQQFENCPRDGGVPSRGTMSDGDQQIPDGEEDETETSHFDGEDDCDFHELYLLPHPEVEAFYAPILFEDGMDYAECDLYYAAHASSQQSPPKATRSIPSPSILQLASPGVASSPLRSCLRPQRHAPSTAVNVLPGENDGPSDTLDSSLHHSFLHDEHSSPRIIRRCSYSGHFRMGLEKKSSRISRSRSDDDLPLIRQVEFEEYVQVVTIPSSLAYPPEIRKNLWMSKRELSKRTRRERQERKMARLAGGRESCS